MKQKLKSKYISGAVLLLASSVIVKVVSAFYKIPLTGYIGAEGRGYFTVAYNLCLPIHALTMGAFPIALTKLVSTAQAKGNERLTAALRAASRRLFLVLGLAGMGVMLALAGPYSRLIASSPDSVYTILVLAPSVLFSCLCAAHRAYAEGFLDMRLTSVSQLIEAVAKLVFGLLFSRVGMMRLYAFYMQNGTVMGIIAHNEREALAMIYPLTSALAMLGVTLGTFLAWCFAIVYDRLHFSPLSVSRQEVVQARQTLLAFSVSIVGATVVQSLANFADTSSVQYALSLCDAKALSTLYDYHGSEPYTYVFGVYAAALDFRNLLPSVVMALGVTAVPAVSAAYENMSEGFSALLTSILKYCVLLSSLGGILLMLLSEEIPAVLFGASNPDIARNAPPLLFLFGATALPLAVSSTAVYCAQALGFAGASIPSFVVGAVIRVVLNLLLIPNSRWNVFGTAVSSFFGYLVILIWNLVIIRKKTNAKLHYGKAFAAPLFCAAVTYVTVYYLKNTAFTVSGNMKNLVLFSILCLLIFVSLLIFTKTITFAEIKRK